MQLNNTIMKLFSVAVLFIIFSFSNTQAQDFGKKSNKYRVWITLADEPFEVDGILYELKDSSLLVSNYKTYSDFIIDNNPTLELKISNIELIETRKRNRVGKGIIIGAVSGFAVGGLIGLARGDDAENSAGQKAVIGGVSLAIPGALVGMLVGAVKVVIPIEGSLIKYKDQRQKLQKYSTR